MKNIFTLLLAAIAGTMFLTTNAFGQTTLFSDDFESGMDNWITTGQWDTTSSQAYAGNTSLTESPNGNYLDNQTTLAILDSSIDLSTALAAEVKFWAIYDIETGFDYMYVEASLDGGATYLNLATFNGQNQLTPWVQYTYSLGGFVGNSDVRLRFRFFTDGAFNVDGMYIDDFEVISYTVDNAPPLVLHTPPEHYEASLTDQQVVADLIDISGIASTNLTYVVDGGLPVTIAGTYLNGNKYLYVIPAQSPGAYVDYQIFATDNAPGANMVFSDTYSYVSGNYIKYDNAVVDLVTPFASAAVNPTLPTGCAVRITLTGNTNLTTALIRNYTDINNPIDSMTVHIWDDAGGFPGADLIAPITVFPEANLLEPNKMTRLDLRPFSGMLSNLVGDIFVGFTAPYDSVWTPYTTVAIGNRTLTMDTSGAWFVSPNDYHFRVITDTLGGSPDADYSFSQTQANVSFTDLSANTPTSWLWDFDDAGATSTMQNPSHTFSQNGTYNVCLTASNANGSDQICKLITVNSYLPPLAGFNFNIVTNTKEVMFTDISTNSPDWWRWDFDDSGNTSTVQNPTYTFITWGMHNVCLTAANSTAGQGDTACQNVDLLFNNINDAIWDESYKAYPNPLSNYAFIDLPDVISTNNLLLIVNDVKGNKIEMPHSFNSKQIVINAENIAAGMYEYRLFENNQPLIRGKLIVQ